MFEGRSQRRRPIRCRWLRFGSLLCLLCLVFLLAPHEIVRAQKARMARETRRAQRHAAGTETDRLIGAVLRGAGSILRCGVVRLCPCLCLLLHHVSSSRLGPDGARRHPGRHHRAAT